MRNWIFFILAVFTVVTFVGATYYQDCSIYGNCPNTATTSSSSCTCTAGNSTGVNETTGNGLWWRLDGTNDGDVTGDWDMGSYDFFAHNITKDGSEVCTMDDMYCGTPWNGTINIQSAPLNSTDLDFICAIDGKILKRNATHWGCANETTGSGGNSTFNQTLTDELYAGINWGYNQTEQVVSYLANKNATFNNITTITGSKMSSLTLGTDLAVADGGTGASSFTASGIVQAGSTGTAALSSVAATATGTFPRANGAASNWGWSSLILPNVDANVGYHVVTSAANTWTSVMDEQFYRTSAKTINSTSGTTWTNLFTTNKWVKINVTFECEIWVSSNGTNNGVQINVSTDVAPAQFNVQYIDPTLVPVPGCISGTSCTDLSLTGVVLPATYGVNINGMMDAGGASPSISVGFRTEIANSIAIIHRGSYCEFKPENYPAP